MRYLVLYLLSMLTLESFCQNDRIQFKTYWKDPMSDISIPLLIVTDSIDFCDLEMPQLITSKIDNVTEIIVSVKVEFDKGGINRSVFEVKGVELYRIYVNSFVFLDKFLKKDYFQTYIWNVVESQLLKWYYVQPYDKWPMRWKIGISDIPIVVISRKLQLIPSS